MKNQDALQKKYGRMEVQSFAANIKNARQEISPQLKDTLQDLINGAKKSGNTFNLTSVIPFTKVIPELSIKIVKANKDFFFMLPPEQRARKDVIEQVIQSKADFEKYVNLVEFSDITSLVSFFKFAIENKYYG